MSRTTYYTSTNKLIGLIRLNLIFNGYGIDSFREYMENGVADILVKLVDTKLEIGSSVSINSYSMKVRMCLLLA